MVLLPCLLTHYAVSYLVSSRFVKKRLAAIMAFVGLLPDIDVFLGVHRWATHSIVPPLIAILVLLALRRSVLRRYSRGTLLALLSLLLYTLHPVMDVFTAPTPLFWPLTDSAYGVYLDVEGFVASKSILLKPTVIIEVEPMNSVPKPVVEGPVASTTGIIIAIAVALYELLELLKRSCESPRS